MPEPKVRFKRDDRSSYPAWERQTVGDMTVELTDYKPLGCGLPLLTSARTGLMFQDEYRGKTSTENEDTLFSVVPRGAVTYRHMSDDNIFHFNINDLVDAGLVSKEYPVFNTINGNNNRLLVEYLNSSNKFLEFCKAQKKGGTRTRLYFKVLKNFEIVFPCAEEQEKIADFLSSVDEVITASEEEVANLETQKKAVMKKIFSQEVRFKRADGSDFPVWEEKRLGEIADVSKLAGFEFTKYVTYSESGNIIAIRGLNVKNGRLILDDVKYLDGSDFSKLERSKLYVDDIMFTYVGTIGDAALVPDNDKYYMAPNVCRIRVADELPGFIMQQLLSDWFKKTIIKPLIATSSQPALSMENIRLFKMCIPCLEEQRLIADFLSDFDEAIAAAKKELELWKELKKGLLQQMFV